MFGEPTPIFTCQKREDFNLEVERGLIQECDPDNRRFVSFGLVPIH